MRPPTPKVGHLVTYFTAACKPLPARVTVVTTQTTITLKVLSSNQTVAAVVKRTTTKANTWEPF